ncbi:DNA-binding protein [Macrococcus sp. DPC7161]|nr:DNA-binding protein [Macrococcus sp. DPC7161]
MKMLPKISKPATRALNKIGITTLEQVASRSDEELLSLHGVGPKAIKILQVALSEKGLKFKQDEK